MSKLIKRTVTEEYLDERDEDQDEIAEAGDENEDDAEDLEVDEAPKRATRRRR